MNKNTPIILYKTKRINRFAPHARLARETKYETQKKELKVAVKTHGPPAGKLSKGT